MAKAPKTFTLQGSLNDSSAEGLSISAVNSKGTVLDSELINGTNSFELSFKTKKHSRKPKKAASAWLQKISTVMQPTSPLRMPTASSTPTPKPPRC